MNCITYARYSARPQGADIPECESLDTQNAIMATYCARAGLVPKTRIEDPAISARISPLHKRPGGAKLIELAPRVGVVVCYSLSRLFRDVVDGTLTMRKWRKQKVIVHSTANGIFDTSRPDGRLQVGIKLLFDEYEADNGAVRVSDAMIRHVDNGRVMGGTSKYGWEPDPERPGYTRANEWEQTVLAEMVRLKASGLNPRQVAAALQELGYLNRDGRPWHHESIRRILKRPLLAGLD